VRVEKNKNQKFSEEEFLKAVNLYCRGCGEYSEKKICREEEDCPFWPWQAMDVLKNTKLNFERAIKRFCRECPEKETRPCTNEWVWRRLKECPLLPFKKAWKIHRRRPRISFF